MSDIVEFLRARLDSIERNYEDAPEFIEDVDSVRGPGWGRRDCPICDYETGGGTETVTEDEWYEHADRMHERSYMLADVEAKRRIVEQHAGDDAHECAGESDPWGRATVFEMNCPTLRLLALPYADHPDYDEAWRP